MDPKIIGGAAFTIIVVVLVLIAVFAPSLLGISPPTSASESESEAPVSAPSTAEVPASAPVAPTPVAPTPASAPTSSAFTAQTNITNTTANRISTLGTSLIPGTYTKGKITFTIKDHGFGNANAVANITVRDKTTKAVIISTKKSFPVSDRPSKIVSVDLVGTYTITGNEEVAIVGSELYGGYRLDISNGSVSFAN